MHWEYGHLPLYAIYTGRQRNPSKVLIWKHPAWIQNTWYFKIQAFYPQNWLICFCIEWWWWHLLACTYIHISIHIHKHTHANIHTQTHIPTYTPKHTYKHTYIQKCTHTYKHTVCPSYILPHKTATLRFVPKIESFSFQILNLLI